MAPFIARRRTCLLATVAAGIFTCLTAALARASEADLLLPDLRQATFHGISGYTLLMCGTIVCFAGLAFGLTIYRHLRDLPVHKSMLEVSELIYETCKTYLRTQGKFILLLWCFIAAIMVVYFGFLQTTSTTTTASGENLVQFATPLPVAVI